MIYVQDYDAVLQKIGAEYIVSAVHYVRDLISWSREKGVALNEPSQTMKLFTEGKRLMMFVQSEIPETVFDDIVRALSVRWSMKDNITDPAVSLNSVKKRLAYCFLKECARTVKDVAGDELLEDEWTMQEMEKLGFFRE